MNTFKTSLVVNCIFRECIQRISLSKQIQQRHPKPAYASSEHFNVCQCIDVVACLGFFFWLTAWLADDFSVK